MTEIIIPGETEPNRDYDSPDKPKDCPDFVPLNDGTIHGDKKYCDLSFECKQIGMYSEYVELYDLQGNLIEMDYLCTGCRPVFTERSRNDKAT